MKQRNKAELLAEIKRVNDIIQKSKSPYLRRDMEKYLNRLKKEFLFGMTKGSRTQLYD
jgi:hypothetical protein